MLVNPTTAAPPVRLFRFGWSGISIPHGDGLDWAIRAWATEFKLSGLVLCQLCQDREHCAKLRVMPIFRVPTVPDGAYEVRLLANDGYTSLAEAALTVQTQILPVLTIVATDATATENNNFDTGVFTITTKRAVRDHL